MKTKLKTIIIKGNPNKQFSITQTKEFYQTLEKIFPDPIWFEADSNSSRIPLDADCYILFSKGEKQTKWLLEKGIPRLKIIHIGTSDFYENKVGLWLTNTRDKTQMGDLQGDSLKHHWTLCRSMQNKLKNFRDALIKYRELTDKAITKTISEAEYDIGISEIFMKEVFNEILESVITESDSPLDYPDTNPYNDPETLDDIRRNQENPADSEHNHYNPIDTIETIFRWLTYEKGKDLDPQDFSIKAEIGTTIKMTNIIRYFISKDLILRKVPCMHVPIGEYQYGIANINTLKFFNSEVENTLSGQTHHSTKKLIPFKYSPIITDSGKDYIIEFYDKIDTDFKPIYTEYLSNLNETLFFLT